MDNIDCGARDRMTYYMLGVYFSEFIVKSYSYMHIIIYIVAGTIYIDKMARTILLLLYVSRGAPCYVYSIGI